VITLAFETSTDRLSVAGLSGGRAVGRSVTGARLHAARLFPLIDEVLAELELRLDQVEALVLADGPGSFTGLRVGAAAAKALAGARPGLAIWTASTLMVRAAGAATMHGARVLVVTSALRGELYAASYRIDLPRAVATLLAPTLATPESLLGQTPDLLVADAPDKLVDRLADQFAVPLIRGVQSLPTATALLSLLGVAGGAQPVAHPESWEPRYGRLAEAQIRWETAHGRALPDPSSFPR
jgi:tRNA threonylcarbamoyladenosine biosynthesis protein TsaB